MKLSPRAIAEFLLQGIADVAVMVKEGRFDVSMFWVGLEGAGTYLEAIASGDVASEADWLERLKTCGKCPSATPIPADPSKRIGYCGKPLDPDMAAAAPTCGCLLAGKCRVASQSCPQRKWGPVDRVDLTISAAEQARRN